MFTEAKKTTKSTVSSYKVKTARAPRTPRRGMTSEMIAEKKEKAANKKSSGGYYTIQNGFKVKEGVYNMLERNVKERVNTMLLGPTGVGKTELISNLAGEMGIPLTIFDMGTMTDAIMSFVGSHIITVKDGVTSSSFQKSRFSEIIQHPGIVLLDELPRSTAAANNLLFPVLDFRRELPMEYCFSDPKPVKVHPECVFFATANIGGQYTGSHKMDRALIDRFMLMEIDPISKNHLISVIKYRYPTLSETNITKMVDIYFKLNEAHEKFEISFSLSIRHVLLIAGLVRDGFTQYDSFYSICKGLGGKEALKSIESIIK